MAVLISLPRHVFLKLFIQKLFLFETNLNEKKQINKTFFQSFSDILNELTFSISYTF